MTLARALRPAGLLAAAFAALASAGGGRAAAPRGPGAAGAGARGVRRHRGRAAPVGRPRTRRDVELGRRRWPGTTPARLGAHRQGQAAGPGQRVRPRRAVVAGPDGALATAAGGEDDAVLARPLRHRRPGHAADAGPEHDAAAGTAPGGPPAAP